MTSSAPTRCEVHGLVSMPGGGCVLCRRKPAPSWADRRAARRSRVPAALVACALVLGGAMAWQRRPPAPAAPPIVAAPEAAPVRVSAPPPAPRPPIVAAAQPAPARTAPQAPVAAPAVVPDTIREAEAYVAAARARRAAENRLAEQDRARRTTRVVMYSTSWCGYCKQARAWLAQQGIAFDDHDIERDEAARARARALQPSGGVPLFEINGRVVRGFSPGRILAAMTP